MPWFAIGLVGLGLFLVGRRQRRQRGETPSPRDALKVTMEGADSLWLEAHDAFGAPIPTISGHEASHAGEANGPIVPFGN